VGWRTLEQLNAYVVQLPCWYYSPSYNAGMTPANVLFTEADLASHILRMCLHQWQDQYSLQEKGDDSYGHAFSSSFSQGYQALVYPRDGPCAIW
jgi:hypothetical protein